MAIIETINTDKPPPEKPEVIKRRLALENLRALSEKADADLRTKEWHRKYDHDEWGETGARPPLESWDDELGEVDRHEILAGPLGFKPTSSKRRPTESEKAQRELLRKMEARLEESEARLLQLGFSPEELLAGKPEDIHRERVALRKRSRRR